LVVGNLVSGVAEVLVVRAIGTLGAEAVAAVAAAAVAATIAVATVLVSLSGVLLVASGLRLVVTTPGVSSGDESSSEDSGLEHFYFV